MGIFEVVKLPWPGLFWKLSSYPFLGLGNIKNIRNMIRKDHEPHHWLWWLSRKISTVHHGSSQTVFVSHWKNFFPMSKTVGDFFEWGHHKNPPESLLKRQVGNTGGCNPLNKNAEKILLMVQKSGKHQLRLVVYPDIYQGFIPCPQYFKHLLRPLYFAHGCVVEFGIPSMEGSFSHHFSTEVGEVNEGERKICVFPKIGGKTPKMDGLKWKTLLKWMIWGYHYFWKHPYCFDFFPTFLLFN